MSRTRIGPLSSRCWRSRTSRRKTQPADEFAAKRTLLAASGIGGYPFVGTPDKVAEEFAAISRAGLRGIAVSFVNYLNDVPYFCAEVLPRLARMGLRSN